jgi:ankyrin repeat protein
MSRFLEDNEHVDSDEGNTMLSSQEQQEQEQQQEDDEDQENASIRTAEVPVEATACSDTTAAIDTPSASLSIQSLSSTFHRTITPTFLPADERIVESWIQQSLTMPSATTPAGEISQDAGVPPSTSHRRERSLGSGFFVESDYSGIYSGTTPIAAASTTSAAGTTGTFQNSWSNHSTPNPTTEDFLGFSSPSILGASAGSFSGSSSDHQRPLTVSRIPSSASPAKDDDVGSVSSVIHDAARITNWDTVVELCKTQPAAAAYIGRDGWTALHHACNRRCPFPEVVEALIQAYPDALLVEEDKGWLPLHYACRFKAPKDVVRLLLHMYPENGRFAVSRPDRKGRTPLYYAVRYDAPAGVVGLLLEVDASAVLEEDQNADSPLALVWDAWAEKMDGKRTLSKILGSGMDEGSSHYSNNDNDFAAMEESTTVASDCDILEKARNVRRRLESQRKILEKWNTVNVFLKAAFGFALDEDWEMVESVEEKKKDSPGSQQSVSGGRNWRILHAVSSIKCHHSLFLLAAALHPEQAFELDNNDLKRIDNIYKSRITVESRTNLTALHLAASSRANEDTGKIVVTQLLSLNPGAAESVDSEGSTPLHRISENNYKSNWLVDGVREIYDVNPNAVRVTDLNGRLPLHRAASAITYHSGIEDEVLVSRSKICRLLQENEDGAHHPDIFGCLPLHLLAQYGKGWDAQAQALYDANISAVRARTGLKYGNRLPLHLAAGNPKAEYSLISKLIELNPRGASQSDRLGFLPLHLACESGLSWKCVQSIHEAYPEAINVPEQNERGWRALHMATSVENSTAELITNLVQLDPTAASVADLNDRYPFHLACMAGKTWETGLSTLFDANPSAISAADKDGLLPLHIVSFQYCAKTEENGPKVIDVRSRRLSKSAASMEADQSTAKELQEAKELGNLFNLLKADPTVL